jgi:hypothetical protein
MAQIEADQVNTHLSHTIIGAIHPDYSETISARATQIRLTS